MFAVLNVDTGDFYSESPALQNESQCARKCWDNTSLLPAFARRYTSFKEAVRRAQRLINKTGGDWHAVLITDLG
jgi:hypothetical protein